MPGIIENFMGSLFASDALLPSGWARDVLVEWDGAGIVSRVSTLAQRGAHETARGPLLPGIANVHSHAFQRAMAGLAAFRGHPADDFWTWREEMYRLVTRLEPGDVEAIARHLYIEMLRNGYTTVAEFHYIHNDRDGRRYEDPAEMANRIVTAAQDSGIALTLLPVLYAHGGFGHKALSPAQRRFGGDPAFVLEILRDLAAFHLPDPLLRLGVAPHSVRAVDALMLTELLDAATRLDATMPVHMHVSEQVAEVTECIETHGTPPFAWINDLADVDARWCFIHATHLTQLEMRTLGATGACVGLCPMTEADLGDGIFELVPWFEARRPWSIGGDSHVCVSPFEELRALEYSQRLRHRLRNVVADEDSPDVAANLWLGAAQGGAQATGQPVGAIAAGRRADLVALDGGDLDFEGLNAASALGVAIFSGRANRVRDVWIGGERVVEGGVHAGEDAAAASFRAALKRLRGAQ
ncbi:MAG: formimidoylglutamate deiminase [Usitatibacter sp.]